MSPLRSWQPPITQEQPSEDTASLTTAELGSQLQLLLGCRSLAKPETQCPVHHTHWVRLL